MPSDIHGILPAREAVLADVGHRGCEQIVINLDDLVSDRRWPAANAMLPMSLR